MLFINNITKNKLILKTLRLFLVSIVANVPNFFVPIYVAYEFGISSETDSFFLCYGVITFVSVVISSAVRSAVVPPLKDRLLNKVDYENFVSSILYYLLIIMFVIILLIYCINLFLLNVTHDTLLYNYLNLCLPILLFSILNSYFYGILNSLDQYYQAEMSPFSRALIIFVVFYFFSDFLGISAVIIGYNLGEFGKFMHLLYILKKNDINLIGKKRDFFEVKKFFVQSSFVITSTALSSAAPLINRFTASTLIIGSISLLDYGDRFYYVLNTLLNSFLVIILSKWATDMSSGMFELSKIRKPIIVLFLVSSVLFLITFLLHDFIVSLMYPNISPSQKDIVSVLLILNMAGFIFNSMSQVMNRAMIVMRITKLMMVTSFYKIILTITLNLIFAKFWGIIGIGIATALVHFLGFILNYYAITNKPEQVVISDNSDYAI